MNHYIKKIVPFLAEESIDGKDLQALLYDCYRELHPRDNAVVKKAFGELNTVLEQLTLQEQDRVWDLTCSLCFESEQQAFLEGLRVGIQLSFGEDG